MSYFSRTDNRFFALILIALCAISLTAADNPLSGAGSDEDQELQNLAAELVKKRAAVERLSSEVELKKAELREKIRSLTTIKSDLDRQHKIETMKISELNQKIKTVSDGIQRKKALRAELKATVARQIESVRKYIGESLPFKTSERLAELDKVAEMLARGDARPETLLGKLWSAMEDEFRMTRESGLYRQTVVVNAENMLADVARLGMTLMYFQTIDDGRVGFAVKRTHGWSYITEESLDNQKRIRYLFDCLKKHIREGFYELPNPFIKK